MFGVQNFRLLTVGGAGIGISVPEPALVDPLEERLTGDQAAGSISARFSNILSWRLIVLLLIQKGQLSVSGERMCTNTV